MAFASNIAAMNAARKMLTAQSIAASALKEYFAFEKHDGEWHAMQIQAFPQARDPLASLKDEREGIYPFPFSNEAEPSALTRAQAEEKEFQAQQAAADRMADAQQSATNLLNGKEWIRVSSIPKPTKQVWHIADEMVARADASGQARPTRKEVQDECIRRGVASGTARTQYQAWKKANDEAAANVQLAATLSARFNQK